MDGLQIDLRSLWRAVYSEATQLCEAIEPLPDECECGDGDAHLSRRCGCCGGHKQVSERRRSGRDCSKILASLHVDIAMLLKDFSSLAGPIEIAALGKKSVELRRGVYRAAGDLQQISEAFERLDHAAVGFRRTCAVSDLKRGKLHCAELREYCERISVVIEDDRFS